MSTARCTVCKHHPHPNRRCRVHRVDGPASDKGHRIGDNYHHGGRNVTQCPCNTYQPHLNGVDPT